MKLQTEYIIKIKKVSKKRYYEMLEILPPVKMVSNAFLVGEPYDHLNGRARFELYFEENNSYFYGGLATIKDFNLWLIPNKKRGYTK